MFRSACLDHTDRKTSRLTVLFAVAAVTLSATTVERAFAVAGSLDSAKVAFDADYPDEAREQVRAALQREDCKFLRGSFVNFNTTIHYAGKTEALNGMMSDLVKCPGTTVRVQFRKLKEQGDWLLLHDSRSNRFQIQINLDSQRIVFAN